MTLAAKGTWEPITFVQARAGVVQLWKASSYGENADTDPSTPDGKLINIIALGLSQGFDVNTANWLNSFFRSAVGQSLDRILDLFGKVRSPATSSTADAVFYGAPATPIPSGTTVITADTAANRFASDVLEAVGADDNSEVWVERILQAENGVEYQAQVNAEIPSDYTAGPTDTVEDIAAGLRDEINLDGFATAALGGVDDLGNALIVIEIVGGAGLLTAISVGSPNTVNDALEAVRAPVTALESGPVVAAAGTLTNITNPIVGIVGVTNDADAVPGVEVESDDEFRARHLDTLFAAAARTDSGMRAAVLRVSSDVLEVGVTSNRDEAPVDSFGVPIHAVEVVFLVTEGVDLDTEIANAIARQIPAGIEPYGLDDLGPGTTVDGEIIQVFGTRVEELFLWIDVTLTAGEGFPTAGNVPAAVATAIANYFDTGQLSTADGIVTVAGAQLVTDKDMLRTATATAINQATNNATTTFVMLTAVTATPTGVPVFGATDQPANRRQIVRADAARIAVTVA